MAIGTVVVNIAANLQGLTRGLNAASAQVQGFSARMSKLGSAFGFIGGVAGIGFMFDRLASSMARSAREIENVGDSAKMLDTPVSMFSALAAAAHSTGMNLDEFTSSMERFQDIVGSAVRGDTGAMTTIGRFTQDAKAFAALNLESQLGVVADAMAKMGTQQERLALVSDLFGKRNLDMVELLENGSSGLRKMTRDAANFGRTITAESVTSVDAMNTSLRGAWASIKGFGSGYVEVAADIFNMMNPWSPIPLFPQAKGVNAARGTSPSTSTIGPRANLVPSIDPREGGAQSELFHLLEEIATNTNDTRRAVEVLPSLIDN